MSITPQQLRALELGLHRKYRLVSSGRHLGKASGFGIVPDGTKPYEPGDPVNLIDWRATARTSELLVRMRQVEHYARALVCVDYTVRQQYRGSQALVRKSELSLAAAEALVHLLSWQGDHVGLLLSGSEQRDSRMMSGTRAIRQAQQMLAGIQPASEDRLPAVLANPNITRYRPQMLLVVSDLLVPGWEQPLTKLSRKHEIIVVQVLDYSDLHLPNTGAIEGIGGQNVDTTSAEVRQAFDTWQAQEQQKRVDLFEKIGAQHLLLGNDQLLVPQLINLLSRKRQRVA